VALNKENYNYKDPKQVPNLTVDGNLVVGGSSTAGSTSSGSSGTSVGGGAVAQTTEPTNPTAGLVWVNTAGNAIGSQIFRWRKASAGGSSVLTGFDDSSLLLQYTPGYEQVYVNGILLVRSLDYVATTGSSINLNQTLVTGDVVEIFNVIINGVTNTYTTSQADGKFVALGGGSLITPSNATVTGLKITGASSQTADYLSITNAVGTNMLRSDSSGNLTIAGTYYGGSASLSGSLTLPNNNNTTTSRIYLAGGDTNHYIYSTGSGGNSMVFGEYGNFSWYNTATNASYMNLDSGGNLQLGSGYSTANSLRYFDIYNQDTNSGSGSIIRWITQQSSSTSLTTVDMVKYKNGNFVINNNDSAAAILIGTAGTNRLTLNNVGNVGLNLSSQTNTQYPSGESSMEINVTQGGQNALWLKNYAGSPASPTEVTDWPKAVLAITSYGNYYRQTMLSFNLPNDGIYHTDNSNWNFKLNGVTATGWDNNGNTTPVATSTGNAGGNVGMDFIGPGNLRLGTDYAYNVLLRTNGQDYASLTSAGYFLLGYTTSNGAYRLQVNSQIFATSASIATSDAKYKKNVSTLTGGLDMIKALNPVEFEWKDQEDVIVDDKIVREKHNFLEGKTVGFIAQEVQEALKDKEWVSNLVKNNVREAVKDNMGKVLAEEEDFLGIAETNLIAILVSAVKELTTKVESLEAKLNDKS
jgi:hypothetical protein